MAMDGAEPHAGDSSSSSSTSSPAIRILDTVLVPPSTPSSSQGPVAPREEISLPLTFFDIFWLQSPPVERLFLYHLPPDADADAIISNLKSSLSHALHTFYPLAGRIRLTPGTPDRYELHYQPGDGVAFTVAESDHDIHGLATDDVRVVASLTSLLPALPDGGAVLAFQATVLLTAGRRRGLALGVTVHHAACDGAASTHFLHTWAALSRRETRPLQPPVIDRSLIPDPRGLYDVFYQARPTKEEMEFVKMSPDQVLATFVLSTDDLQLVKDAVAAEATFRGVVPPPRCSSLVAALGLLWSCNQRAKKAINSSDYADEQGQQPTCLLFPVDHRTRMQPPVPDKYLGNCVGPAFGLASKADLTSPGGGGLFAACAAVAAAIQEAVSEIGTPRMDAWMKRIREVGKLSALSMAGSPRFKVYELDFGFGAPAKVDIVSVARTGAVAVAESRKSGGGMEVGVSLRPDSMERFRECFADAVAWLRREPEAE